MLGYVVDVSCMGAHSDSVEGLNWRLMLGSAMIPPIVVCLGVYFCVFGSTPLSVTVFGDPWQLKKCSLNRLAMS